ncbi:hypothetical protein M1116_01560 [Patescibacteria group bacterium]|nr:hypothetical protein [Patescibacteria group bacterium]
MGIGMGKRERVLIFSGAVFCVLLWIFLYSSVDESYRYKEVPVTSEPTGINYLPSEAPTPTTILSIYVNDEQLINLYYEYLSKRYFDKAAALFEPTMQITSQVLAKRYADIGTAIPSKFSEQENRTYQFWVDYKSDKGAKSKYRITMKVSPNNLLTTLKTETGKYDLASFGSLQTWIEYSNSYNSLYLNKNGKTQKLDNTLEFSGESMWQGADLSEPRFTSDGRFIFYSLYGWEYEELRIYDIETGAIRRFPSAVGGITWTPDNRYAVICDRDDFGGQDHDSIYSLPDFKEVFNLTKANAFYKNYRDIKCSFNNDSKEFFFKLGDPWPLDTPQPGKETVSVIYNLATKSYREE